MIPPKHAGDKTGIQRKYRWTSSDRSQTRMLSVLLPTSSRSHLRHLHRYHLLRRPPSIVPIVHLPLHRLRIMHRRITPNPHRNLCNIWGRYSSRAKSSKWSRTSPTEVVASASSCEMLVWRNDAPRPPGIFRLQLLLCILPDPLYR